MISAGAPGATCLAGDVLPFIANLKVLLQTLSSPLKLGGRTGKRDLHAVGPPKLVAVCAVDKKTFALGRVAIQFLRHYLEVAGSPVWYDCLEICNRPYQFITAWLLWVASQMPPMAIMQQSIPSAVVGAVPELREHGALLFEVLVIGHSRTRTMESIYGPTGVSNEEHARTEQELLIREHCDVLAFQISTNMKNTRKWKLSWPCGFYSFKLF